MQQVAVLVTHRTRKGQRDAVRAVWEQYMAPAIAANAGHVAYFYCFDEHDLDTICAFQVYRSADDAAAFQQTPALAAYEAAVAPLLAEAPAVRVLSAEWTKSLQPQ